MLPPFDIFRIEPNGEVVWVKAAEDLKSARLLVQELMTSSQDKFLIHSHLTNNNLLVRPTPTTKRTPKPVIFQIAYDEQLMATRAALLKSHGFTVVSSLGNEAAKLALEKPQQYDLFILGHAEGPRARREMADWLKAKYPSVQILALNPPYQRQLEPADFNVELNGPDEWLFIVEASTG
jgi:hypothetical protein